MGLKNKGSSNLYACFFCFGTLSELLNIPGTSVLRLSELLQNLNAIIQVRLLHLCLALGPQDVPEREALLMSCSRGRCTYSMEQCLRE